MKILSDGIVEGPGHHIASVMGELNMPAVQHHANIMRAIRLGLPQLRGYAPNTQRIAIVGSGPSLDSTLPELRQCAWEGWPIVAMNGSYQWLIDHNLRPSAMVLIDGRDFNSRFLTQHVKNCDYFLASQCHPSTFDRVRTWPRVILWHCLTRENPEDQSIKSVLDDFYLGQWQPVPGGCTVGLRSLVLFKILGYTFMDLFGLDSCYLDGQGHAMAQPENDAEGSITVTCAGRAFQCSAWHCEQYLGFLDMVRAQGQAWQLHVHGDGLIAHAVRVLHDTPIEELIAEAQAATPEQGV